MMLLLAQTTMEDNVGRDVAGQSEKDDEHGKEAVLDHVLAPIGTAVEEGGGRSSLQGT